MEIILNFVYNHAAPRHCLNKFSTALGLQFILRKEDETMKTNSIYKTSLLAAALLLAATSCVKDELHPTGPTVATVWTSLRSGQ